MSIASSSNISICFSAFLIFFIIIIIILGFTSITACEERPIHGWRFGLCDPGKPHRGFLEGARRGWEKTMFYFFFSFILIVPWVF
jgi:hypothetical protein